MFTVRAKLCIWMLYFLFRIIWTLLKKVLLLLLKPCNFVFLPSPDSLSLYDLVVDDDIEHIHTFSSILSTFLLLIIKCWRHLQCRNFPFHNVLKWRLQLLLLLQQLLLLLRIPSSSLLTLFLLYIFLLLIYFYSLTLILLFLLLKAAHIFSFLCFN